ncbi:MAG: ATPase, P-type, transporting, HAD superfamily, subfamily IC [Halonotius sp. J07HN6]|nr:MAG: ATPase, P-type, transporting, HAD superfamily, subfamily IC [Halonotius sp. J07HN6]
MSCTLCGLPTPEPPVTGEAIDGEYCCRGCLEVATTVGDVEEMDADTAEDKLDTGATVSDDGDHEDQFLHVDGMHCATCETFLEATATDTDGVHAAQASYATDTLKLQYDPAEIASDALPGVVSGYGYTATEQSLDDDSDDDNEVVRFLIGGGFFGMMTMMWYLLFLYPTYFGFEPLLELGGLSGLYLFGQLWLLNTLVLGYTGYPILRGAYVSLRAGQPNMDLLVAVAAVGAYLYSTLALLLGRTELYFDVSVAIILVVTAGNYYETKIKQQASKRLSELTAAQVEEATRPDGTTVPVGDVEPGDELLVRPGERIPVDGEVVDGVAAVDEALVTGESIPRTKRPGDEVRGGTVVTDQPLTIRAGEDADSTLDRIVALLWDIQSQSPGVQRLADKLATVFVPVVVTIATATTVGLLALGHQPVSALLTGLTVLIVSCPCALGLATPLAVARGIGTAAEHGLVVASETVFERPTDVDVIALDKTGTLTTGEMTVTEVVADETDDVLATAATIERAAAHPVADAIVATAADRGADSAPTGEQPVADGGTATQAVESAVETTAIETLERGVRGTVDGRHVLVGHPDLFETGWCDPHDYGSEADRIADSGQVAVVVGWDGEVRGVIAVGDEPKGDWDAVLDELAEEDREIVVLSGDDTATTAVFGEHPAVDEVFAGSRPREKRRLSGNSNHGAGSPWSATAATTRRHWRPPISVSPSQRARNWRPTPPR